MEMIQFGHIYQDNTYSLLEPYFLFKGHQAFYVSMQQVVSLQSLQVSIIFFFHLFLSGFTITSCCHGRIVHNIQLFLVQLDPQKGKTGLDKKDVPVIHRAKGGKGLFGMLRLQKAELNRRRCASTYGNPSLLLNRMVLHFYHKGDIVTEIKGKGRWIYCNIT